MSYTLLVDLDGVIADYDARFWDVATEAGHEFDIEFPHQQTKRYFSDHIVKHHKAAANKINKQVGWFRSLPVVEGAQEGMEALHRAGVDVWLCTKPLEANPTCRDEKGAWVAEHFPHLLRRLIITPDKSMVIGDVLLDDAPKLEWLPHAQWLPVIFTRPFNGAGSDWQDFPHFKWDADIGLLHPDQVRNLNRIMRQIKNFGDATISIDPEMPY